MEIIQLPLGTPTSNDYLAMDNATDGTRRIKLPLPVTAGGTGATTLSDAKTNLGIPSLPLSITNGGTGASNASDARTNLGIPTIPDFPLSVANGGTGSNNAGGARINLGAGRNPYMAVISTISSLPVTFASTGITSGMRVIGYEFSDPSAFTSDLTVTTSNGSLTVTGTMSGSSSITLFLSETRTV